jgi:excisionase family DNA binding protein
VDEDERSLSAHLSVNGESSSHRAEARIAITAQREPSSQTKSPGPDALSFGALGFRVSAEDFTVPNVIVFDSSLHPELQPALDIPDVARLFKVSEMTVRRLIANRKLPATKIGALWRIRPQDAAAFLNGDGAE